MMNIELVNLGKKFNDRFIFRGINFNIASGQKVAILGTNGSGKSTLLQIIAALALPSEGQVNIYQGRRPIELANLHRYFSISSPMISLFEELTAAEMIGHYGRFKPFRPELKLADLLKLAQLSAQKNQVISTFSSGMKQRLKLTLALCTDAPICLLDEPTSNLDEQGVLLYHHLTERYLNDKTTLVCSNSIEEEHRFCDAILNVNDYKRH